MKTIKQHLESIEDEQLRDAALRVMSNDDKIEGAVSTLFWAFDWESSIEGFDFWKAVYYELVRGNTPTYSQFKHLIK